MIHSCVVPMTVTPPETATQHCQLLASAAASSSCASQGFVVAVNCGGSQPTFTVTNSICSTPLAVGIVSTSSFPFDQTYTGALPDGELDSITAGSAPPVVPALPSAWPSVVGLLLGAAGFFALRERGLTALSA
jgi:hypothetical protein